MTENPSRDAAAIWLDQNQAYLGAEFARLRERLAAKHRDDSKHSKSESEAATTLRSEMASPPAIDALSELLGLTDFERQLLLLSAGVEMDSRLAEGCGEAQGSSQKPFVTFGLALAVLPNPHWDAITPSRPLRRLRVLELQRGSALTTAPLRVDERVLHYLAGSNQLDQRLASLVRDGLPPEWIAEEQRDAAENAARVLAGHDAWPLLHLCWDDPQGHEDIATFVANGLGRRLIILKADALPASGAELDDLLLLLERESLLLPAAVLVQGEKSGLSPAASHLVERLPGVVFVSTREPVQISRAFARLEANKPGPVEQRRLWVSALGEAGSTLNGSLDAIAEQFRLSARAIASTAYLLASRGPVNEGELWDACRSLARPRLDDLAQRVLPRATWDDLVLPDVQKETLRQLAAQVRHRMKVYETWGFATKGRRGLGVSALFTGGSGTGKTMAAEVLAGELRLDLYRIDLSSVVSKYIGETEKNLKQIFDTAEDGGVLLLFDEADALFGKRSEVRDSRDRYANIEVGYLLQRLEAYQGLAILTTNLKSTMDSAFQRRLRFIVNFPFPDAALREAIWKNVLPEALPTQGLDREKLAQLNVAGGSIRNIAVNAAFLAAQVGKPVGMHHLADAARLESQKIERPLSSAELQGWE